MNNTEKDRLPHPLVALIPVVMLIVFLGTAHNRFTLVGTTACSGLFLNITTGDQFFSIVLTADMYRNAHRQQGCESRLLSRTTEDVATVTSVLIPWSTCGMTQAAVLGIPTLVYLPYCFFNIISPLMTLLVAAIGWKIYRTPPTEALENEEKKEMTE